MVTWRRCRSSTGPRTSASTSWGGARCRVTSMVQRQSWSGLGWLAGGDRGGTYRAEALHDVLANDERAVALYTACAERDGQGWEDETVLVMRIQDGKIAEQWQLPPGTYTAPTSSWS